MPNCSARRRWIRRQRKICGDESGLALADHLEQIELAQCFGIAQRAEARIAKLDRDRVECFAFEHRAHRFDARPRNVRGAEQHEFDVAAAHACDRLFGKRPGRSGAGTGR